MYSMSIMFLMIIIMIKTSFIQGSTYVIATG